MAPRVQDLLRHAYCKVVVDGKDVTDKLDPHLISVQVVDRMSEIDSATIELDDRDGRLDIPFDKVLVQVWLGWQGSGPEVPPVPPTPPGSERQLGWEQDMGLVFQGYAENVESGFARSGGGGRRIWIEAKGADLNSVGKQKMSKHWGEGAVTDNNGDTAAGTTGAEGIPLSQVLMDAAKLVGYNAVIGEEIGKVSRNYWYMDESPHNFFQRTMNEVGGIAKIAGNTVYFVNLDSSRGAAGAYWSELEAYWGINLIAWRIKPYVTRSQYKGSKATWFDTVNSKFRTVMKDIESGKPFDQVQALAQLPAMAPNRQVGDQSNESLRQDSRNTRGQGWCIINGNPHALALHFITISGARPGVDGRYRIQEAEHNYTRAGGYTTRLQLMRPELGGYEDVFETRAQS